jgi:acetyl esterase/lipase
MKSVFLLALACAVACAQAPRQHAPCATPGENNPFLDVQTIRLWSGAAPQAIGDACQDIPTLTIFDPQPGHENGSAVVIFPGGAYSGLATNLEGRQIANWFNARGFKAFVLRYRLSSEGYLLPIPLLDARRAIQTVRARARDYHVDPNRIALIGFSAGGHLAALAATQPVEGQPEAVDTVERV